MRRVITGLNKGWCAVLLICFFATPAIAGWHTTEWGMSKEEVEEALGHDLVHVGEDYYELKGKFRVFNHHLSSAFYFPEKKLSNIIFYQYGDAALQVCFDVIKEMEKDQYTIAGGNTNPSIKNFDFLWKDQKGNAITLIYKDPDFGEKNCSILFTSAQGSVQK